MWSGNQQGALTAALPRGAALFVLWLVIAGAGPSDLAVGAAAAAVAGWTSIRLLPPGGWRFRPVAILRLAARFLVQSVAAGVNVAWRALDPRMPLRPGFVLYRPRLPAGASRNAFCTMASLLPGTLPCGTDDQGNIVIHCLDLEEPVAEQYAAEEALFTRTLGGHPGHG